nr:MAG TPA: Integrin alpha-IIb, Integrin beta-3, transmembrane signaling, protein structure [Caudoviricetes sp.]
MSEDNVVKIIISLIGAIFAASIIVKIWVLIKKDKDNNKIRDIKQESNSITGNNYQAGRDNNVTR